MDGWFVAASNGGIDYRSLVADSADLNTVASIEGVYRHVSPACRRLFGWDPSELEGHHQDDFVHPHDIRSLQAARAALADTSS